MRLASRQFAYFPRIMDALFHSVQFTASPQHIALAAVMDFTNLAHHVKNVVFQPDKYSWIMTKELFEEIVLLEPLRERCKKHNEEVRAEVRVDGSEAPVYWYDAIMYRLGWRAFVKMYMDGIAPWSDKELDEGYERYMVQAHATRAMFNSGDPQMAWAAALTQLPNVGDFRIGANGFAGVKWWGMAEAKSWKSLGCEVYEHDHSSDHMGHSNRKCQRLAAPVGEALFSAAVGGLITAGSTITNLSIECVAGGDFEWADDGQLDGLDLSHLQKLRFRPDILEREAIEENGEREVARVEIRCARAVMALLKACRESLKDLELFPGNTNDWPLTWPPSYKEGVVEEPGEVIELPALERLKTAVDINLSAFAEFLLLAKKLKRLELDSCAAGYGDGGWRDLWRAIRHHPSRMQLEFDQLPCNDATEWSTSHFTGEASMGEDDPDDTWMNIDYELDMYMSNMGPWGRSCRMWFEGLGSDDEYTDSESGAAEESDGSEVESGDEDGNGTGSEGENGDEDSGGDGSEDSAMQT